MKKMMDSTTAIITTTDNRVLLQKRDENPDIEYSGCYSLVSGYLEEEETPLDGIIRELKEEFEHARNPNVHFSSITYLGLPLFTVRLFKRRIRDCPNIEIGKIITRTQNMIRIK